MTRAEQEHLTQVAACEIFQFLYPELKAIPRERRGHLYQQAKAKALHAVKTCEAEIEKYGV